MSDVKDKVRFNDTTYFFMECPECASKRNFDRSGVTAISLMGGGSIAAILAIFAFIGTVGLPFWILLVVGGQQLQKSEPVSKFTDEMASKLYSSVPIFKKWEAEGVGIFKCPKCGNNEIVREV